MYVLEFVGETDALPALEAESAATAVEVVAPGLAVAGSIVPERVPDLALVRAASDLVARTDAAVDAAVAALDAASLDREGTVAVRARDVRGTTGVDTQAAERALGSVLVDRGFEVDLEAPDHELRALFAAPARDGTDREEREGREQVGGGPFGIDEWSDDGDASPEEGTCLLGWTAAESRRDFGSRAPTDRAFFQPGSMDPMLARALVNVALADRRAAERASGDTPRAGAHPGATLLDPMCGTGGILVEAGLVGARVVGADAQRKMVAGARRNLAAELADGWDVLRADATRLPLRDDAVDAAVFDVPYERQSTVAGDSLESLVAGALAEARRVAPRAVAVGDRDWSGPARDAGWTVDAIVERRVHRSLVRHCHVLVR